MPNEIEAQPATRLVDAAVGDQLDEIADLVLVQVVRSDEPDAHRGGRDPLLEVGGVELEAMAQELDDEVVS